VEASNQIDKAKEDVGKRSIRTPTNTPLATFKLSTTKATIQLIHLIQRTAKNATAKLQPTNILTKVSLLVKVFNAYVKNEQCEKPDRFTLKDIDIEVGLSLKQMKAWKSAKDSILSAGGRVKPPSVAARGSILKRQKKLGLHYKQSQAEAYDADTDVSDEQVFELWETDRSYSGGEPAEDSIPKQVPHAKSPPPERKLTTRDEEGL
jgi:hypothetical protein